MVPGVPGLTGLVVLSVVEELRPGGDFVTVQPRPMVGENAMVILLKRDSATLSHVQVHTLLVN